MAAFLQRAAEHTGREFRDYHDLYDWSVEDIAGFWELVWRESGIIHSRGYDTVLTDPVMPGARWFVGAQLNFAENLLRYRDDRPAVIAWREQAEPVRLTFRELYDRVAACANGLRRLGVGVGDRVAAYLPNTPEAIIAMLAATALGAVWSSCSPDFGLRGVLDRFGQIGPRVLLATDGYIYNGTRHDCRERVRELATAVPDLEHVVVVPLLGLPLEASGKRVMTWNELLSDSAEELTFAQQPFDHPVYIMYSSGTTGAPKCIVHGAGGTLLQHWKEHALHTDLRRGEVISYYTTTGWMMWNWLVSALQLGATVFLYEGSPSSPDLRILWDAVDHERIAVFGTSPRYLAACERSGLRPHDTHELTSLRTILSTGAPLPESSFNWVYNAVKPDVQLASISGGTDIISCFMLGNPLLPVFPGEIQCRGLGMKVETWSDDGRPVTGEVGELVCTAPFVSMPVGFWNDPDGARYRAAYFDHFPGVWRHGDFIRITEHGGVIVYGRSDATLNPGGVRIGTAEIYAPVEALPEVADSLVVGQSWNDDVRVVLFVVLREGCTLDDALRRKIRQAIREQASPRHVPALILQIDEVPYTRNGKKVELAVRDVLEGRPVKNREALANPHALDQFVRFPELRLSR